MEKNTIITLCMWEVKKLYNIPKDDFIVKSNQCFHNPAKDWKPETVVFSIKGYLRFTIFINKDNVKLKASRVEKQADWSYQYHPIDDDKIQEAVDNRPLWGGWVELKWLSHLIQKK